MNKTTKAFELRYIAILFLVFTLLMKNYFISFFIDIIVIITYIVFFYRETRFLFLYSFIIFSFFRLICSLFILEYFSVFLLFSNQLTFYKGSLDEFLLVIVLTVELFYFFYKKIEFHSIENIEKTFIYKVYYFILFILMVSNIRVFLIRYNMGYIHRVEFANRFLENNIFNHFTQIIIMGGIIVAGSILKSFPLKGILLIFLLSLYSYLIGEKFGYFYYILCFVLIGIAINTPTQKCKKYFKYISFFSIGMIFCCIAVISTMYKISHEQAVQFFEQRIYQDNESWWYFYDKDYNDLSIKNEIEAFKYRGIGNLYEIGYQKARLFGSHMLAEKIRGYDDIKGEYERKKRISSGSFTQIKLYGRGYYAIILVYAFMTYFILKNIIEIYSIRAKNFVINLLLLLYVSILLRFLIQVVSGLIQINNEFFSVKAIYFLIIIYILKFFMHILKNKKYYFNL